MTNNAGKKNISSFLLDQNASKRHFLKNEFKYALQRRKTISQKYFHYEDRIDENVNTLSMQIRHFSSI